MATGLGVRIGFEGETEFRRSIADMTTQQRTLQTEMRATTSAFERNDRSQENLTAQAQILTRQIELQNERVEAQERLLTEARNAFSENASEVLAYEQRLNRTRTELNNFERSLRDVESGLNTSSLEEMTAQQRTLETELRATVSAYDQNDRSQENLTEQTQILTRQIDLQNRIVNEQERLLREARSEFAESSTEVQRYAQQLNRSRTDLNNLNRSLQSAESELNGVDTSMESGNAMADVFTGTLAGGLVAKGLEILISAAIDGAKAMGEFVAETEQAIDKTQAMLGLSAEQAAETGEVITAVYGAGFTDSMEAAGDAVAKVAMQMEDLSPEQLEKTANQALILEKTFGIDVQEGLRGADALMKQFGIDAEEAYDLMTVGAQKGLNQNGDLADQIAEYATYYADAGYSAEEMFSTMKAGTDEGVYQLDKLNDSIKEFNIRAKDPASTEAFEKLGLDATAMLSAFAEGGTAAQTATEQVNQALFALNDEVLKNELGVQLYGTTWEDLGSDVVQTIATAQTGLGEVQGATMAAGEAMTAGFSEQMRIVKQETAAAVAELLNGTLSQEQFVGKIEGILTSLGKTIEENGPEMTSKGIELIVSLAEGLGQALPELTPQAVNLVKGLGSAIIDNLPELVRAGGTLIGGLVIGLINAVPELIIGGQDLAWELVGSLDDMVIEFLTVGVNIVEGIGQGIINAWGTLVNRFKDMVGGLVDTAKGVLGIQSPSKVFQERIGAMIPLGLAEGVDDNAGVAVKSVEEMSQMLLDEAEKFIEEEKALNDLSAKQEAQFWEDMKTMAGIEAEELTKIEEKARDARLAAMEEEQKRLDEQQQALQDRADELRSFVGLFDEIATEEVDGKALIDNLEAQNKALQEWANNMDELAARGLGGALLDELNALGPAAASEIEALTKVTDEELKRYMDAFAENVAISESRAASEQGLKILTDVAGQTLAALKAGGEGGASGVQATANEIATQFAQEAVNQAPQYFAAGASMTEGLWEGIESGESTLINNIVKMLRAAVAAAKEEMDINSPSKVWMGIGGDMAGGLDIGWAERMRSVSQNINQSLQSVSQPLTSAIPSQGIGGTSVSNGDINVYVDKVDANDPNDVRAVAEGIEFMRKQQTEAKGVRV